MVTAATILNRGKFFPILHKYSIQGSAYVAAEASCREPLRRQFVSSPSPERSKRISRTLVKEESKHLILVPDTFSEDGLGTPLLRSDLRYSLETTGTTNTEFAGRKPQTSKEDRKDDYYANMGDAIRTLREDIPCLFMKDLDCTWHTQAKKCRDIHEYIYDSYPFSFLQTQSIEKILFSRMQI